MNKALSARKHVKLIKSYLSDKLLPVLLLGKSHGGGSWWATVHGVAKSRTRLSNFTFAFLFHALEKEMATHSSIFCLGNPRDGSTWWVVVYGVAQSRTRLKRLSSSSKEELSYCFCEKQQNKKPEKDIFHFPTTGGDVAKQIEDVPC